MIKMRDSEMIRKDIHQNVRDIMSANVPEKGMKRAKVCLMGVIAEMLLDIRETLAKR